MTSLVDNVLAVEKQADDVVAEAHAKAKQMHAEAETEIAGIQEAIQQDLKRRIAAFRADAENRHKKDVEQAQAELAVELKKLSALNAEQINTQTAKILTRFREW